MAAGLFRRAVLLGLMSAVGPFAIDMYLPALPAIGADLGVGVADTQATLTAYFVCFGLAQLFYGPWSDAAGRRTPAFFGFGLFVLGSLGAALAPGIGLLTLARAVQGLGAAAFMVVPRAIIRDWYTGHQATRMMATIMLVISVSPMLAPLAGSLLILAFDWRAIFWVLAGAGLASMTLAWLALPETLAPSSRRKVDLRHLWQGAQRLLRSRKFMGLTLLAGCGMSSFFIFIASASFVYTGEFGLSPTGFSLAFAVNAVGFFGASQMAATLGRRYGADRLVRLAAGGFALATVSLYLLSVAGLAGLSVVVGGLFLGNACLGLVLPTTMVLALDDHGDIAGLASSLGGTLQMLLGGATIALGGLFFDGTARPMLGAIAICGLAALLLALFTRPRIQPAIAA